MSKQNTGYANTVPQFAEVLGILKGLKDTWNPVNEQLYLVHLQARYDAAQPVLDAYELAFELDKLKTAERIKVYESLNSLVQRILAAATSCKMTASTIEQIKTYKNVVDGSNVAQANAKQQEKIVKIKALIAAGETPSDTSKARSVSKQTYDLRYDNFKRLLTLLTAAGNYKTNVPDLTLEALNTYLGILATANAATNNADKDLTDKRNDRDACLCNSTDSICAIVKDIKAELISIEGKTGDNYKKVTALQFMSVKD